MLQADYATARIRIPMGEFGRYLRTGWWAEPGPSVADVEVKFNPWHDPATGRFTSKGAGDGSWGGGGFTGGGGGSFGGGGATGSWEGSTQSHHDPLPKGGAGNRQRLSIVQSAVAAAQISVPGQSVERNGYTYRLDSAGRTTQATGTLTLNSDQARSRSAQATAGGADRLSTDDGGHYVAVRFNGPTDTFNHFAQDTNFNRGGYRVLEGEWASDIKQGKTVWVKITPQYAGSSQRPSEIDVVYTVNGKLSARSFTNSSKGKSHGR